MKKKAISLLFITFLLGIPLFSMVLLPVNATTGWSTAVNITDDPLDDFQSVITYDPTQSRTWHVAWVKNFGEVGIENEIMYTNEFLYTTIKVQITNDVIKDWNPMIDMDNNGVVHIVWVREIDATHSDIFYTNSTNWAKYFNISRQEKGTKNWQPTLVVEKDTGVPHIAWVVGEQEPPGDIYYRKDISGALMQIVQTASWSLQPSIDLDASKNVHVVWSELDMSVGDMDVRYTNSTMWPAMDAASYLNVSDIIENQEDDLRPDIAVDKLGRPHVTYYQDLTPNDYIYFAFSPNANNTWFWNTGDHTPRNADCKNPSIKVSTKANPVIIYQGKPEQALDNDIFAIDYNGSWAPLDISNNAYTDQLEWSSIGALDIDSTDNLYATYYSNVGAAAPNWEVFVVEGTIQGEGVPAFEILYLMLAICSVALMWIFYQRKSIKIP